MNESRQETRTDDIEAIRQLKAHYFRLIDTKDWAGLREVLAQDVTIDVSADGAGVFSGIEAFMSMPESALREVVSIRHRHMPEIHLTSPTTASEVWAMEDILQFPAGHPITDVSVRAGRP